MAIPKVDGMMTYVVSVETASVTFQTPSMSFFWGGTGKVELRLVAGEIGSELLARLRVRLSVWSQLRVEALKSQRMSVYCSSHLQEMSHLSSRIVPIMTGTELIEPCSNIIRTLTKPWRLSHTVPFQ